MTLLDRYILRLTLAPLGGALGVTLVALLLERVLRLLDLLSESSGRLGFVVQLAVNLVPHYLGLTLPAGLSTLQNAAATNYPIVMAGAVVASVPVIALFVAARRHVIASVAQSGIKG